MLFYFLLFIVLPITLISLVVNHYFGFGVASLVWITLLMIAWTLIVWAVAKFCYEILVDRWLGNSIWIIFEGPFAIWIAGVWYNKLMSLIWQYNLRKEEALKKASQFPNTRPSEPF